MSDFNFEFDEEAVESAETVKGGFGVLDTGKYGVTINFASLGKSKAGENTLGLDITTDDGHRTTLWAIGGSNGFSGIIDKLRASGAKNYGYDLVQSLMGVNGVRSMTPEPYELKKDDGTLIKELSVVKELTGKKCTLAIVKVLDFYQGEEKEKNEIHSCYNAEGKTYLEAKGNLPADKIEKVVSRLKDKKTKNYLERDTDAQDEPEEEMSGLL